MSRFVRFRLASVGEVKLLISEALILNVLFKHVNMVLIEIVYCVTAKGEISCFFLFSFFFRVALVLLILSSLSYLLALAYYSPVSHSLIYSPNYR